MKSAISRAPITASTGLSDSAQIVRGANNLTTVNAVPYVSAAGVLNQDTSLNWTTTQSAYPTGLMTIGTSTQAFQFAGRGTDSGATQGVPYFRSATANTATALDIMPNGFVSGSAAWIDVCANDLQPLNSVDYQCAILSMRGRVWSFSNGSLVSIVVAAGTATVTTGSAHGLSSGAVAFQVYGSSFSPGTSIATITVTGATTFTFASGKPNGTYTTGMIIAEFGTINLGSHYSTGAYGANINIGGVITTLADRVESGSPVAYAAFTDAVATFKSAGVDKVRWSSSKLKIASDQVFGFQDNTNAASGSTDAGLSRVSAGIVGVGTGAAGSAVGQLNAGKALLYDSTATTGVTTLTVKAGAGQSSTNLQEWQNSSGTVLTSIASAGSVNASSGFYLDGGGTWSIASVAMRFRSDSYIGFASGTNATGTLDTSLSRISAGVVGVGTGAAGSTAGTLQAATLQALGNGSASNPMLLGSGTWFTGGSATTTKPYLLIEPKGTTSTGWSTSGTGIGVNAASGFAGRLLDLQVAGSSVLSVTSLGTVNSSGNLSASSIFATAGGVLQFLGRSAIASSVDGNIRLLDSGFSTFGLLQFGGTTSSFPALKRSTTGLVARLADDSADTWVKVKSVITGALTVATLPASPTAGERAFVTDSNAVSFTAGIGAVVASGGSTAVPVVYDGTSWRIG